ncbi:hypothetical protein K3495_g2001 [Podosphaera aphanis]|nr:hypothetical protein K3495_g2001 [Podosphaera aphanis]
MKLCITNNVSMSIGNQLNRLKTAKEMWDAIANQYESSGIVLNQQAIAQYIKINYTDYDSIDSFIMAFHNAVDMLKSLNIAPPDSWHPLLFLLSDEARVDTKPSGSQMALNGKNRGNKEKSETDTQRKSKFRPKPTPCNICGNPKARHSEGKCFEDPKNKDLRKQWEKANNKNSDDDNPRFGGLTCITLSGLVAKSSDRWILDKRGIDPYRKLPGQIRYL